MIDVDENVLHYTPIESRFKVNTDFFVIALKNLIANAIAYSPDHQVLVLHKKSKLYVINKGQSLRSHFETYTKAFVREDLSKNGMGLGLYLAKEIFLKHGVSMKYRYFQAHHMIILDLKKIKI
jgi:two-component system OmpR family sensor kinase